MTLADKLRELKRQMSNAEDWSDLHGPLDALGSLVDEAEKLNKAVVAFDAILFPSDLSGDEQAAHMRDQLVTDLADAMDRHGWAGTLEENVDLIDRLTTRRGFDGLG